MQAPTRLLLALVVLFASACGDTGSGTQPQNDALDSDFLGEYKTAEILVRNIRDHKVTINGREETISRKIHRYIKVNRKTIEFGIRNTGLSGGPQAKRVIALSGTKEVIDDQPNYNLKCLYEVLSSSGPAELKIDLGGDKYTILTIADGSISFEGDNYTKL